MSTLVVNKFTPKESQRLFSKIKVDLDTHCWEWVGALRNGYGHVYWRGGTEYVHRIFYACYKSPLPKGVGMKLPVIDHTCDNRKCCNPEHLRLTTIRENILRGNGVSAECARKTHCPKGHPLTGKRSNGKRFCITCQRAYDRKRNKTEKRRAYNREYYRRKCQSKRPSES